MKKNILKTTLGCLLVAILIAGCEKNQAPQATSAAVQVPIAAQATGANPAAGQAPLTALSDYSAAQRAAWDDACAAAIEDAGIRGASNAEFEKITRSKMCSY